MSMTDQRKKSQAALLLASSASYREIAEQVGVSTGTLRTWRRQPEFAAAVEEVRQIMRAGGRTGPELHAAVSEVLDRLTPPVRPPGTVSVSIPAGASPARKRRLVARALARAMVDGGQV
ncbi:MAG: hypothetical protein JWO67_1953 [Streptosporangiaceae bacterium]|nr:hypothetical protein [Streptosporangiaceae bacterium]